MLLLMIHVHSDDLLYADQTPTPTRFLRNCEESGLFQELEEANPFEQDFKDATPTGSAPRQPLSTTQSAPNSSNL
jgi:cyclic AMP-dependent transcription factor ATF-2